MTENIIIPDKTALSTFSKAGLYVFTSFIDNSADLLPLTKKTEMKTGGEIFATIALVFPIPTKMIMIKMEQVMFVIVVRTPIRMDMVIPGFLTPVVKTTVLISTIQGRKTPIHQAVMV